MSETHATPQQLLDSITKQLRTEKEQVANRDNLKADYLGEVAELPEAKRVAQLEEELQTERENLAEVLNFDENLKLPAGQLLSAETVLKGTRKRISNLLVAYGAATSTKTVPLGENGEPYEIRYSAKVGKVAHETIDMFADVE